jgi:3'-5' exonuclease
MLDQLNIEEVLFIDIETVPVVPNYEELDSQWQKLWADKMKSSVSENNSPTDLYPRAGIYAEFGRIIVISAGYLYRSTGGLFYRVKSFYDAEEKALLANFAGALNKFSSAGKKRLCAHNGQEFDYPYISRRMLVNGIQLPSILNIAGAKPWETKELLIDTLQLWKFGDFKHYTSLSLLCALFNIPTPKDDIDGSQVSKVYYEDKDLDRIIRYCEKDTLAVANLLLRYKGMDIVPADRMQVV